MASSPIESIYEIEQIERLPRHLKQHIVEQHYDRYTPVDHAVWRYIMKQAFEFHSKHAHEAYVEGLRRTGISLGRIPRIEEMNQILGRIGWGAAPVDGFIPPAAFMEFQAHRVLVIAADMRQVNHIEYTPAPDIVHEAAGHAPIIADEEYAEYLRRIGEVGAKALSSRQDFELYEAIRHLSILKEAPGTPPAEIAAAEKVVADKQAGLGEPSEMARLSRLHWWTVEYGLVGDLDHPKLYGAGLLSSIGEAVHCLTPAVTKLPYSVAAADVQFDITNFQPQLFVTPSFAHLNEVLEEFAATMAYRRGGLEGLRKAHQSTNVATFQYSSGLQVSGVIAEVMDDGVGAPTYVRTSGPTALAVADRQLPGHGKEVHHDGFGSPVGRVRGMRRPLELHGGGELERLGIEVGRETTLHFDSGLTVAGRVERLTRKAGNLVLISFSGCRARRADRVLFEPGWGDYDMAVGARIESVFHGAADKDAFEQVALAPKERTIKASVDDRMRRLHTLYGSVREARETGGGADRLGEIWRTLQAEYQDDWLLPLEVLEVVSARGIEQKLQADIRSFLEHRAATVPGQTKLISDGLRLLAHN